MRGQVTSKLRAKGGGRVTFAAGTNPKKRKQED